MSQNRQVIADFASLWATEFASDFGLASKNAKLAVLAEQIETNQMNISDSKHVINKSKIKLLILSLLGVVLPIFLITPQSLSQSPQKIKSDTVEYREMMAKITRQLGVTCTTCHNTNNFQDASKREFVVAKNHLKIVQVLIDAGMNGLNGNPQADCYMCHRGVLKPNYKEPFDPLTMKNRKLKGVPGISNGSTGNPASASPNENTNDSENDPE